MEDLLSGYSEIKVVKIDFYDGAVNVVTKTPVYVREYPDHVEALSKYLREGWKILNILPSCNNGSQQVRDIIYHLGR